MTSPLRKLLSQYRDASKTEREKGTYFERLTVAFLKNDPGMKQEYEDAWLFNDWAKANRLDGRDIGIDAVAKIRGEETYCAIQCKFYREGYRIQKGDIDSFLSSAQTKHFSRGLIIETTGAPWSVNALALLDELNVTIIDLDRLEASPIDWEAYFQRDEIKIAAPKELRTHQSDALKAVKEGLAKADRGKIIMACGTGKTFTGLKIAEDMAGAGKTVLVLVPSLALMSQTIREWTIDSQTPLRSYAVCSDAQVGKRKRDGDDVAEVDLHDLDYPATTNAAKLASRSSYTAPERMTVVFSTYQSIAVISDAQRLHNFPEFDLIICDEAHRTTGATFADHDESNFVKIHNQDFIAGKKRIYMTATPRIYADSVKGKAKDEAITLASMDDEALYGQELFVRGFGWAVENGLLTDYKVLVLAVDEAMVSTGVQNRLADGSSELKLDDATKIIGCYKALIKSGLKDELLTDQDAMRRGLIFAKDIKTSKLIRDEFAAVVNEYLASDEGQAALGDSAPLECQLHHVDGTMGAKERNLHLDWLKEAHDDHAARLLTNARCLSEGVDVPALDAVLFMHPRKSQIDVVQSVGRVMRRAEGKRMGYIILPIGVPAGMTPEEALNDNERYRVVWEILNALRSHDERFEGRLNQADLGQDISDKIEVIAVSNKLPAAKAEKKTSGNYGEGSAGGGDDEPGDGDSKPKADNPFQNAFVFDEFTRAIMAKIVKKCGRRDYWEDWAGDIAKIAQTHISRITGLITKDGSTERKAFTDFLAEIRDDLNDSISEQEAIEMLAQHLITRPVFDALFEGYSFAQNNPVSKAMEAVLGALDEHAIGKEADSLQRFYDSVKRRAQGIEQAEAKQKIIVELYDKFFRNAFPKMTERLGIVYTPVEVVDFILHSVNEVLQSEFGQTLGSKGVHILDPFTGTGTFVTRLLQSGLIKSEELEYKYRNEIHANELVLLAYYIAAINIEAVYHSLSGGDYAPFEGICLTDTFQLYEQDKDLLAALMPDNSNRRTAQKARDIRVIVANPPYSAGQSDENDNAANLKYTKLDLRIRERYAERSKAKLKNALYDSYIRAFRWASDRIGDAGVIAYVSNAGWLDGNTTDGLRQCLVEEFASIHVFHLRGNQRTSGERSRREGGKIFGSGSRTPVAITLLVKNPNAAAQGQIYFYDIGDYLSQLEKLKIIAKFGSIGGITKVKGWSSITPDQHGDWLGQREKRFDTYIPIGIEQDDNIGIFNDHTNGFNTSRDCWAINDSKAQLSIQIESTIKVFNGDIERIGNNASATNIDDLVDNDSTKISWSDKLKARVVRGIKMQFHPECISVVSYRPFNTRWLYGSSDLVDRMGKSIGWFSGQPNRQICISGKGSTTSFSALMHSVPVCYDSLQKTKCFPRYLFERDAKRDGEEKQTDYLANSGQSNIKRRDAITDEALSHFQAAYPGEAITKDDLFHYVYGLLHSEDYRARFADNLSKQLPRIPAVKQAKDFLAFVEAGRRLGDLHCDFEGQAPFPVTIAQGALELAHIPDPERFYRVEKMKFGGKRPNLDKSTVIYNSNITITGIPVEAYDYIVNGKPALEWVMERQCVKTDKASGIANDPNRYAIETVGDPAYPLRLFQQVITVSMETIEIVRALPRLEIG